MKTLVEHLLPEAYDIFPKSEGEIDALDNIKHDKEKLKALLKDIIANSDGVPDPIALQSKTTDVKVFRPVADNFNLPALSKKYGMKVTSGNGSRGGRGAKSQGFGFEGQVTKDIETYIQEGESSPNFKFPEFMKELHDEVLSKHEDIQVALEGGANTKRPLEFTDVGVLIGGRELDVGQKVTDVTVFGDGTPYYLSLKFGGTVTFFNAGVATIFTKDQFEKGKITDLKAKQLLKVFGIDEQKFIDTFVKYDKKMAKSKKKEEVNTTRTTANLRALLQILVTGIGYGYYMVHRKGKKVEFYKMTRRRMMDSAKIKSVKVIYPAVGTAKRIDIEVVTKLYIFKINIRNKQGGVYPSHIMCDYKPNPSALR